MTQQPSPSPTLQPAGRSLGLQVAESGHQASALASCAASGRAVSSSELLQGGRTVEISHNGTLYRLQATRLGKLILTK